MYKLDKMRYLAQIARRDPFELFRLARIAGNTAYYRFLRRCAGRGSIIGPGSTIVNCANVTIGKRCLLQDGVFIRAGAEGKVVLGDGVAINSFCRIFGHGGVYVGDDTQIGPGTLITTTGHDFDADLESDFLPVTIGRSVWIGANATVLPGVTVGDHAVVGAGSVVTRDVPPWAVAVGVPARVIKQRASTEAQAEGATGWAA